MLNFGRVETRQMPVPHVFKKKHQFWYSCKKNPGCNVSKSLSIHVFRIKANLVIGGLWVTNLLWGKLGASNILHWSFRKYEYHVYHMSWLLLHVTRFHAKVTYLGKSHCSYIIYFPQIKIRFSDKRQQKVAGRQGPPKAKTIPGIFTWWRILWHRSS